MIAREGAGWQMVIADLSLILFMVTALALEKQPEADPPPLPPEQASEPLIGEALAVYRPEASTSLPQWLAEQDADPRQQLTIIARHSPGQQALMTQQALALAGTVKPPFGTARLIVEPAQKDDLIAVLAHDLARGLQGMEQTIPFERGPAR